MEFLPQPGLPAKQGTSLILFSAMLSFLGGVPSC